MGTFQLLVILVPFLLSIACLCRDPDDFLRNKEIFIWVALVSVVLSLPALQETLSLPWQDKAALYVPALFTPAYIVWGRFELPSAYSAFAGSFLTLFLADIASVTWGTLHSPQNFLSGLSGIGGAGLVDGLVVIPLASVAVIGFIRFILKSGRALRFMVGRKKWRNGACKRQPGC